MEIRIGQGLDVHPFGDFAPNAKREIVLGGVAIPADKSLVGHSDADVLTHAIMDALLGAAGLGDIGTHFPNTDPAYKGADSLSLLSSVMTELSPLGWKVVNVDATIVCETPKISPHVSAIKRQLSERLAIDADAIGIKATTAEKLGSLGRGEGIFVSAVALLMRGK